MGRGSPRAVEVYERTVALSRRKSVCLRQAGIRGGETRVATDGLAKEKDSLMCLCRIAAAKGIATFSVQAHGDGIAAGWRQRHRRCNARQRQDALGDL